MGEEAEVDAWRRVLRALVLASAGNGEAAHAILAVLVEQSAPAVKAKGGRHANRPQ